jgi:hypothetical protein
VHQAAPDWARARHGLFAFENSRFSGKTRSRSYAIFLSFYFYIRVLSEPSRAKQTRRFRTRFICDRAREHHFHPVTPVLPDQHQQLALHSARPVGKMPPL